MLESYSLLALAKLTSIERWLWAKHILFSQNIDLFLAFAVIIKDAKRKSSQRKLNYILTASAILEACLAESIQDSERG